MRKKNNIEILLFVIVMLCCSCGSIMEEEAPPLEISNNNTYVETKNELQDVNYDNEEVETNFDNENEVSVMDDESMSTENEFFTILDEIKDVHPGTAGSSLKALYVSAKLLNMCRAKLPFSIMTNEWIKKQDANSYDDIKESVNCVIENMSTLNGKNAKSILEDSGITDITPDWDELVYKDAKGILNDIVFKLTK